MPKFVELIIGTLFEPMQLTGMRAIDVLLRILCALLAGIIVGFERELSRHPAGLRTNMLVSLGSCIVMITAESICNRYAGIANPDPARLGAQVISGVGFLGAGTIIHKGVTVQGLTTAASLWTVACLGLAAGNGDYFVVIVCAILISLILSVVEKISLGMFRQKNMLVDVSFETTQLIAAMNRLDDLSEKNHFSVSNVRLNEQRESIQVGLRAKFKGKNAKKNLSQAIAALFLEHSVKALTYSEVNEH